MTAMQHFVYGKISADYPIEQHAPAPAL